MAPSAELARPSGLGHAVVRMSAWRVNRRDLSHVVAAKCPLAGRNNTTSESGAEGVRPLDSPQLGPHCSVVAQHLPCLVAFP